MYVRKKDEESKKKEKIGITPKLVFLRSLSENLPVALHIKLLLRHTHTHTHTYAS